VHASSESRKRVFGDGHLCARCHKKPCIPSQCRKQRRHLCAKCFHQAYIVSRGRYAASEKGRQARERRKKRRLILRANRVWNWKEANG
jgi:hypothetical protein